MPTDVVMPQMGESIFEGTITKWLKQPGDKVTRDEPLFEISTDKVDAEIPAPATGVLREIKAEVGKTVQVNTVVAVIDESGAAGGTADGGASPTAKAGSEPGESSAASDAGGSGAATDVVMPQMGESIFEGTITKWLKKVGEQVTRDEPLFEISTDKVDAEIPAPASGVLLAIKAETGTTVQVNSVVAVIGGADGGASVAPAAGKVAAPAEAAAVASAPAAPVREVEAASGEEVRSSPLVRKLASEHNVDLRQGGHPAVCGARQNRACSNFERGGAGGGKGCRNCHRRCSQ